MRSYKYILTGLDTYNAPPDIQLCTKVFLCEMLHSRRRLAPVGGARCLRGAGVVRREHPWSPKTSRRSR